MNDPEYKPIVILPEFEGRQHLPKDILQEYRNLDYYYSFGEELFDIEITGMPPTFIKGDTIIFETSDDPLERIFPSWR